MANSANAFEAISIDVHQLVGFEQSFNLRPDAGQQCMKFFATEIAEAEMNNPRRRRLRNNPVRKICILADDNEAMLSSKIPNL